MARMTRRTKPEPVPQTDAVVGRDLLDAQRQQNEAAADLLVEGQKVQYFDDGWRYGVIEKLPDADEVKYGQVRIMHQATGRVWVPARDVKPLEVDWAEYFKARRTEQ